MNQRQVKLHGETGRKVHEYLDSTPTAVSFLFNPPVVLESRKEGRRKERREEGSKEVGRKEGRVKTDGVNPGGRHEGYNKISYYIFSPSSLHWCI